IIANYSKFLKISCLCIGLTINLAEEDMKKLIAEAVAKIDKKFEIPKDKEEILGFCEDFGIET
ncbi:MAG: hypothetical protein WCG23_12105, partial [bacterium]